MKTLLALLLLIPNLSWGVETFEDILNRQLENCKISKEYEKWDNKNESVWKKRKVYVAKCILDHSKNSSTVPFKQIQDSCYVLAADKHKTKGERPEEYVCKK